MPKITYDEFRPGHWVKKVDGEVVGPATAAEVAAWKQERAAPARIWDDVVATASRPPSGEVKVAKPPAVRVGTPSPVPATTPRVPATAPRVLGGVGGAGAPAQPGTPKEPDQSTLWEDLVKRARPSVQAEGPPEPRQRQEDTDWAEQAQIWQDVVKRARRPEAQPEQQSDQGTPISPTAALERESKPATRTPPAPTAVAAEATRPVPAAEPEGKATSAEKVFAAEVVSPKLTGKARRPTTAAEPEAKAVQVSTAPAARPAPKPTLRTGLTAKALAKPAKEPAPAERALPAETPPASKARTARATPQRPVGRTERAPKAAAKTPSVSKPAARGGHPEPAAKESLPARLLDEIDGDKNLSAAKPTKEAASAKGRRQAPPAPGRERTGPRTKSSPAAVSRRTAGKGKPAPPQEQPNQLYLWMSASQADDLIAVVRTGLARYQERFSHAADVVLCHSADLPALEGARLPVDLREGKSLAPRNFWIGSK